MIRDYSLGQLFAAPIVLLIYVIICDVIARAGRKHEIGYWKIVLLSFFGTPILGALYILIEKE